MRPLCRRRAIEPMFRRATPADVTIIRDLTRAAYAKWVPLIGREPKPMLADYGEAVTRHIIDLYEADGEVAGLVEVIPQIPYLLIENIAVLPTQQGKGLGGLLLIHAENLARSLDLDELRLYTNAAFTSNIEFYARRGFHEFLREPFHLSGITVHMKKAIAPAK
jgi:N-acetylglutamate synthase-like GNAT family acetyltransferase